MRRNRIITAALVAATTLTVGPITGASAKRGSVTKLSCKIDAIVQGAQPSPSGMQLGFVSCPRPFGTGLHYSAFKAALPPAVSQPTVTGSFKNYYDRGTTSGTFVMTFTPSPTGNITYTGTVTYTGGTGRFRHVQGGGTIQCTTTDFGAHKSCAVNSTLTGI